MRDDRNSISNAESPKIELMEDTLLANPNTFVDHFKVLFMIRDSEAQALQEA